VHLHHLYIRSFSMINQRDLNPSRTVLTIVVGFVVVSVVTHYNWALWVAIIIGIIGLLSPLLAQKIQDLWMGLALILSYFIPPILLSLIFFLMLFPIAVLSRLFGEKDPLQLKRTNTSLFKNVDRSFTKESFEKPF